MVCLSRYGVRLLLPDVSSFCAAIYRLRCEGSCRSSASLWRHRKTAACAGDLQRRVKPLTCRDIPVHEQGSTRCIAIGGHESYSILTVYTKMLSEYTIRILYIYIYICIYSILYFQEEASKAYSIMKLQTAPGLRAQSVFKVPNGNQGPPIIVLHRYIKDPKRDPNLEKYPTSGIEP